MTATAGIPVARPSAVERSRRDRAVRALLLIPGALTVFLGFEAGGYFPGAPAVAAVVLAVLLALRLVLAPRPFEGAGWGFVVAAGALALYALWTLASASWSHAPGRAVVEFDRALLYLLALVLLGSLRRTPERLRWLLRGVVLGIVVVCAFALLSRLVPDLWATSIDKEPQRLSYPLTYWNALGILAAFGCLLCFAFTTSAREPRAVRVLAAAALPALAITGLLTFSRGAIGAGVVGLLAFLVLGRPRALLGGVLAAAPPVAGTAWAAYGAKLLTTADFRGPSAVAEGHRVGLILLGCMAGAAALRGCLLRLDESRRRPRLPAALRRPAVAAGVVAGVVALGAGAAVAAGVPGAVAREYHRFVQTGSVPGGGDPHGRLFNPSNNGRIRQWRVALDAFDSSELRGRGAGTYALTWDRHRAAAYDVSDAHSLYLETLGELGVVGLALLGLALVALLGAALLRARGPDRALYAALFAAGLMWALHAAVDWDWELPAVTVWLFAAGGLALASPRVTRPAHPSSRLRALVRRVPLLLAGLLALGVAVTPARVALARSDLDASLQAFADRDCGRAVDRSLASVAELDVWPEPYEVMGYCDAATGADRLAVRAMHDAVRRDPGNWEAHYGLALVRAAAGLDPRAQAHAAVEHNPLDTRARDLVRCLDSIGGRDPRAWRAMGAAAPLPTDSAPLTPPYDVCRPSTHPR